MSKGEVSACVLPTEVPNIFNTILVEDITEVYHTTKFLLDLMVL